jgi:hypothetical protein
VSPAENDDEEALLDGQRFRSLELTVLQQVREGLSLVNANMRSFGNTLSEVKDRVMAIELAKFDQQIAKSFADLKDDQARVERELQRQIDELKDAKKDELTRSRTYEQQLARYGAFLAVFGTVGGAVVAAIATKVFGG